ncbi:signal-transducing adaptor protein 1-like [Antennarius striatus]|uniref:signal-transducing adaptor protein 1-like n=1 Tax=Antennarius striatus TaxID=241820 RepID=UPI0035B0D049
MSHPRVVHRRRETITALPLYYSGHLLKKLRKEKDFNKYHAELRGATLFLYQDETQYTYTEKLDLKALKSMVLDSPYQKKAPTVFTLTLNTEEVQLKMDNPDTGEVWRCYILTVMKRELPSKLQLLPGQVLQLQDVLAQEKRRILKICPPLPLRPPFLDSASSSQPPPKDENESTPEVPACFFNVTRQEAERMLEANPGYGGMILRPSTLANNYALTLRQMLPSGPTMRNYRVTATKSGFIIELDTAVIVPSLNDVLKYFTEKTEYRLHPYTLSHPYDTSINVSPATNYISILSSTPKKVPKVQVAPMPPSNDKDEMPAQKEPVHGVYVVPDDSDHYDHTVEMARLDGELQTVIKLQRASICKQSDKKEVPNP